MALHHYMARKGRRRRTFNLRRVRIAGGTSAGALASGDVIVAAITAVVTDPIRVITADLSHQIIDLGAVADDGYEFGYAHSDYTAAEIEECLEQSGTIDLGSKIAQEQGNRLVRTVGVISPQPVVSAGGQFNDGKTMKTKLNWRLSSGDTLNLWIRNSSQTAWTTGSVLTANGNLWIKDV